MWFEGLETGGERYVTKPLDFPVVLARIRTQLRSGRRVPGHRAGTESWTLGNNELERRTAELRRPTPRESRPGGSRSHPAVLSAWRVTGTSWRATRLTIRPYGQLAAIRQCLPGWTINTWGCCVLDAHSHGVRRPALVTPATSWPECPTCHRCKWPQKLTRNFPRRPQWDRRSPLLYGILGPGCGDFRFCLSGHPGPIHVPCMGRDREGRERFPIGVGMANNREQ